LIGYGEMFFEKANQYSRDPYEIVNIKTGYEGKWGDIYLYVQNLFDTEYNSVGAYDGFYTIYSEPGEIGIQMNIRL
jgi:iron complex outermembrane receptor protein